MRSRPENLSRAIAILTLALVMCLPSAGQAQERGPQTLSPEAIQSAIDSLSNLEFPVRMNAARALRRAPGDAVAPALIRAVEGHKDQFVRFRAMVLLTGFNDARTPELVRQMLTNPNDRVRTVAYAYYEHRPSPEIIPSLLQALEREESEFVRPALVRALAAHGDDPRVRERLLQDVDRGHDFFRSVVIEALGDHGATYALNALARVAQLNGPLQVDAVLALGKLKDPRAMEVLAKLQASAPREVQPPVAAAICLVGVNCDAHVPYVVETMKFAEKNAGFQALLRSAVAALVALANSGRPDALQALVEVGAQAVDPPRAPIALGVGTIAIRNTALMQSFLESQPDPSAAIELIAEGFDMLEEDFEEERFFATVRRGYWQAAEGSPTRRVGEALIEKLEF